MVYTILSKNVKKYKELFVNLKKIQSLLLWSNQLTYETDEERRLDQTFRKRRLLPPLRGLPLFEQAAPQQIYIVYTSTKNILTMQ